jgi:hypothetical protein
MFKIQPANKGSYGTCVQQRKHDDNKKKSRPIKMRINY